MAKKKQIILLADEKKKKGKHKTEQVAKTAYNFVPLISTVLPSPINAYGDWFNEKEAERSENYALYLLDQGLFSGTISLTIKNLTPLFIGDGGDKNKYFFSPFGQPIIPGSTIRGMVRSIFKILTAGTMRRDEDFTDRHLYFRCIMAPNSMQQINELHNYYEERMFTERVNSNWEAHKKAKPGFLYQVRGDNVYYIAPCDMDYIAKQDYGPIPKDSRVEWNSKDNIAYVLTGPGTKDIPHNYVRFLFNPKWNESMEVPASVIQEYRDDKSRNGVDLLKEENSNVSCAERNDIKFFVPCFYTKGNGVITSFGHGRSYRIPYKNSVGDRVPENLQDNHIIDFTDAVFGRKELWAGRVSFEDAILQEKPKSAGEGSITLLGAKPTSYQLYLEQKGNPPAHWDSNRAGNIRGYKLYWHKNIGTKDWASEPIGNVSSTIHPLAANNTFVEKIHFHNLSKIELGALLSVFHLRENHDVVYKLGMGKSLGLGSVRIMSSLQLDDGGRYASLFDDEGWRESAVDKDVKPFLDAFNQYVEENIGEAKESYQRSIEMLKILMDWNNTKKGQWNEEVPAVPADFSDKKNQFVKRYILPTPDKVVNKK